MPFTSTFPLPNNALPVAPLARSRRVQSIADELRQLVLEGTLAIGAKLPTEVVLCQQFGVSRTTLREAIQMLRSTGLLDVTPGRGSYVRAPSLTALLPSLQLAAHGRSLQQANPLPLLALLMTHALQGWQGQLRQREALQALYQHALPREATPSQQVAAETAWQLAIFQLANQPLVEFMAHILLGVATKTRLQAYQNSSHGADEVLRTTHAQLRINQALLDGEVATVLRTYSTWCQAGTPLTQTQAA
jgi:DNA-binding FadR family transcriptional regulator